ncbi:ABC transporter permease subunit [Labrenzia suaedae]|uniref:sn-glycerol-3-phosphate transport system permease protein UgpE n=2 Tax=Roseibium litorale TaxID=2803841 RepID=A0ABR9CNC1_9HYPH|nr:ABC transporter permease subunit [Roseibium litorale]MBD8892109.1 ABC transporter permease subunit [Roseibium litorale]
MRPKSVFDHAILIAGALLMCGPMFALFLSTTHSGAALQDQGLSLSFGPELIANYTRLFNAEGGFLGGITVYSLLWNSFVLGAGLAGVTVALSLMAAYALVYFRPRGAGLIFWLLLLTLMLPLEARFLPTYTVAADLGLVNTHAGLILPLAASGIGTFFFRQFLQNVPDALLESARLDGAGPIKFFKDILVPLSWPMASALFLVTFVNGWNQYLWPVMVTSDESAYTVVRGLQFFGRTSLNGIMLACVAVLPPAVLLVIFQRKFVKGLFDGVH